VDLDLQSLTPPLFEQLLAVEVFVAWNRLALRAGAEARRPRRGWLAVADADEPFVDIEALPPHRALGRLHGLLDGSRSVLVAGLEMCAPGAPCFVARLVSTPRRLLLETPLGAARLCRPVLLRYEEAPSHHSSSR
jgi:hypothetical protein